MVEEFAFNCGLGIIQIRTRPRWWWHFVPAAICLPSLLLHKEGICGNPILKTVFLPFFFATVPVVNWLEGPTGNRSKNSEAMKIVKEVSWQIHKFISIFTWKWCRLKISSFRQFYDKISIISSISAVEVVNKAGVDFFPPASAQKRDPWGRKFVVFESIDILRPRMGSIGHCVNPGATRERSNRRFQQEQVSLTELLKPRHGMSCTAPAGATAMFECHRFRSS